MDVVTRFATDNINNTADFGEDARLAFKRHLSDMGRASKSEASFPYIFKPELAENVINLANSLTIAEGEGNKILTLAGFQEFIVGSLFGWVNKETGKRRFTDSYVQLSRQQGKSILNAVLGIKCSNFDNFDEAQIFCTATKIDQARIVLNEIEKFIKADKELSELFQIKDYKNEITGKLTNSTIKALGRDTKSIDGFRPYLGIVDEYHAHKDNQMYKLLKGGTRFLKQFLISVITTAGFNLNGPCYELYQYCRRVLRGIDTNERQFIYIAQMDKEDDLFNPANWIKCCPLSGKDPELMELMQTDAKKALSMGGAELLDFKTKSLNIWVKDSETAFINLEHWEACACEKTLEDFRGCRAICGLDLSNGGDLTSLVLEFPYLDDATGEKKYFIYSHSFMPKARLQEHMDREDNAPYVIWENEGLLTVTTAAAGVKTDYKTVLNHLKELIIKYDLDLESINYDPANAGAFLSDLDEFGCDVTSVLQTPRSLNDATIDFKLEVEAENIGYNKKERLLTRSMNDAILTPPNSYGEVKIDKAKQKQKIDACDAVICSHKRAMEIIIDELSTNDIVSQYLDMFGSGEDSWNG